VQVAIQPWELEIEEPGSSALTDTVISVRHERGALTIRLTRFTIQASPGTNGVTIFEGQTVGLRAAPQSVRILTDRST
jgi:hypothetical protein